MRWGMRGGALCAALALTACGAGVDPAGNSGQAGNIEGDDLLPTGKGAITLQQLSSVADASAAKRSRGNGITYHGGPVILGTTNVHYIWYGTWSSGDRAILTNLAQSIGGSPYFNINTTYYNGSNVHVSNSVSFASAVNDNYSHGTSLSDSAIQSIVAAQNPTDTNGVYFVLTSADVNETSGFCTQYCGWHTHGTINGRDIKYAFIGNPARCPSACTNGTAAPNGSVGADGAASIISHELEEAVTDPDLNAWYDNRGQENADKCAWTFGTTYNNGTGIANVNFGGTDYLIQRNWVNAAGGYCSMSY
jgi:Phosphate-induced protein 1 conserved region